MGARKSARVHFTEVRYLSSRAVLERANATDLFTLKIAIMEHEKNGFGLGNLKSWSYRTVFGCVREYVKGQFTQCGRAAVGQVLGKVTKLRLETWT